MAIERNPQVGKKRFKQHCTGLVTLLVISLLLQSVVHVNSKRIYSGSSSRRGSSSSSSNVRRTSSSSHTSSGGGGWGSSGSSSSSHAKPAYSHSDIQKLSYGGGSHSQPNRQSSIGSSAARPVTATPIGWNVPPKSGPPPAYSATNPAGGARTNVHEAPPAYKANNAPPPNYATATNTRPLATNTGAGSNAYRSRMNSTGGFGGGGYHTPIQSTNVHGLQSSSYPRQQLPAGATYYPSASGLPAGATYHSPGHLPAGATYHAPGHLPAGATYHPSGGYPAGASYHAPGALPAGATYYPAGAPPSMYGGGAAHYPSAMPAGATYLPAGAAIPAGATFLSAPPRQSSGLGFGSGLAAGALGGALLGHALTPTNTRVIEHVPSGGYGGGGGGGGGGNSGGDDKIIIINNGPPGSVTTTDVGSGTTVINTGQAQAAPAAAAPAASLPAQGASVPLAPFGATNTDNSNVAHTVSVAPTVSAAPTAAIAVAAPAAVNAAAPTATPAAGAAAAEQPPAGGIICVPVRVPEPDPNDATKTIEVEKIACYPAPPAEATPASVPTASSTQTAATTSTANELTSSSSAASAPLAPFVVPEGAVPLAPLSPSQHPDIMKMPGELRETPTTYLAQSSGLQTAKSGSETIYGLTMATVLTVFVSYVLQ